MTTSPSEPTRYYYTYSIEHHPEGLLREDIHKLKSDVGACHEVVIISVMHQDDGATSTAILSGQKDGGDLPPLEMFKAWAIMAHELEDSLPNGWQKAVVKAAFKTIREIVTRKDIRDDTTF